ncbi:hypothetical protein EDB84DRAFT_1642649 [Lactarius hengduanensis]|nr:hypothetical protein EDB84DRAFT_1642649 [Lactarius hengduanensis]
MRMARASGTEAERELAETLAFGLEQCLQCTACARVSYRVDPHDVLSVPVPERETRKNAEGRATYEEVRLTRCVDEVLGAEGPEYKCPQCGRDVAAIRRFATFPDALVVHANKFQLVNWVSTKLVVWPTLAPTTKTDLRRHPNRPPHGVVLAFDCQHLGRDHRPGEPELQNNAPSDDLMFDISVLTPHRRSRRATRAQPGGARTARSDGLHAGLMPDGVSRDGQRRFRGSHWHEVALGAHGRPRYRRFSRDPSGGPESSAEQVGMLSDMGFSRVQADKALRDTAQRWRARLEWLFSHPDDMCEDEQPPPSVAAARRQTVLPQQL